MKSVWNKLKRNRISVTRIGPLVFALFVFFTKIVSAADNGSWFDVGGWIGEAVGWLGEFFVSIISLFLTIAQTLFQAALMYNLRFGDKLEVIKIGWGISRDVANIFFIVVLLVIAIATILRVGSYAAKQLLPGLIIMAILINFSLTIGLVVVDVSNALGLQFYNAITDNNTKTVSELIMTGTGLQNVFNFTPADPGQLKAFEDGILQNTGPSLNKYKQADVLKDVQRGDPWAFAITAWGNAVFMMILVFVFFATSMILLARVAIISVLLMLAPLAFLFYILPDTKSHWSKWWSELIKNCFFLPAFLFLLYLAIVFILKIGLANKGANPGNFISNPGLIFGYIMAVILLLQALILGRSMGAMGASTAMNWATKGRKMASGFVAGQTIGRASERALSSPGVKDFIERQRPWIGRRIQGYLEKGAAAGGRQKSAEATAAFVSRQTATDQAKAWEKMSFAEKQALLRKLNTDQRRKLIDNLPDEQKKLAERILGTSLAADQKADMDASQYQRMQGTEEQKREAFASLSREAKERVLRTMDQKQRADFVQKLRESKNPNLVAAANISEDILSKDFAPNEYTAYKVAQFNNDTAENQIARFKNPNDPMLDDKTRAMILLGMKDDDREAFLQKLASDRDKAEKIMKDHFPPEKLMEAEAAKVNATKDLKEQITAFLDLKIKNPKAYEAVLRKKTDQQRALFLSQLPSSSDKKHAEETLKNMLTPTEYAKYEAQKFLLGTQQEQATMFGGKDATTGEDLIGEATREEILRQKKDANAQALFVENLSQESKNAALKVVKDSFSPDESATFKAAAWNLLAPDRQPDQFEKENEATQEKILRSLTGERRAGFLAELDKDPAKRKIANDIIKNNFSLDEQAAIYAEEWKLKIDTDAKKDKMDFFANGNELAQEKVLAGFKDADERERFISGLERSQIQAHKDAGIKARQLLDSTRFTATQRSEFKKARAKQEVTLVDNANLLSGYFILESDPKIRGEMLEAMNERQQIDMLEEAAKRGPASMAVFSDAVLKMKPPTREAFVTKTISRASNEAIGSYFAQKDSEIQANALDSQKQDELRGEKRRTFKGLRGDTKAALWAKAFETDSKTSNDTTERDKFKVLMEGTTDLDSYRTALGRVLGDKIVSSPTDAAAIYEALDPEARKLYLKSSAGARTLASQLKQHVETSQPSSKVPNMIETDFVAAGQSGSKEFKTIQKRGARIATGVSNVAQGVSQAAATQVHKEFQQEARDLVASTVPIDASSVQSIINKVKTIQPTVELLSPQEKQDFASSAGGVVLKLRQQGMDIEAQEITNTLNLQGFGAGPAFKTESQTSSTTTTTQPSTRAAIPTRSATPSTVLAAPAAKGGIAGEGRKNMNQEAVKAARDASRIETTETTVLSPKARIVSEQSKENPAKAVKGYIALPKQDRTDIMKNSPQSIIAMKEAATDAELNAIENDIQQSDPATAWRAAPTREKHITLNAMSPNNKRVVFEAIASSNDLNEMKSLRSAVSQMEPLQKQEFITNVVAQGSPSSAQKYLKRVIEEKIEAQRIGKKEDVERLAQEETIIKQAVASKSTASPRQSATITTPPASAQSTTSPMASISAKTPKQIDSVTTPMETKTTIDAVLPPPPPPPPKNTSAAQQTVVQPATSPKIPDIQPQQPMSANISQQQPSGSRPVDGMRPGNGTNNIRPVVISTTNQDAPPTNRISTETTAQAISAAKRARGELKTDANLDKKSDEVLAAEIKKGTREREIEHINMAPVVEGGATTPRGVGEGAKEDIAESKEEKLDRELEDIASMENELSSTALDEARLTKILQKIDGKILLLESLRRSRKETGGDATKIQALSNIIGRFNALKIKAEKKRQQINDIV